MPVTLTIKRVPDDLAQHLRERAARNRRSLQRELLVILEGCHAASDDTSDWPAREPGAPRYRTDQPPRQPTSGSHGTKGVERRRGRLSLDELWQRARKLGAPTPSESTEMIRRDRDRRDRR